MMMRETATRGRPAKPVEMIRETVFSVAIDIIEAKGAAAVSIDEIARQSQFAKKTIYKYFANKDALIEEMIVEWTSTKLLSELPVPTSMEEVLGGLRAFFIKLTLRVLSRESIAIFKFLQNDVPNKTALLSVYSAGGIDNATDMLDRWLEDARTKGWINATWPANGAIYLQSLIVTPLLRDVSLGKTPSPAESEVIKVVDKILSDFRPLLIRGH